MIAKFQNGNDLGCEAKWRNKDSRGANLCKVLHIEKLQIRVRLLRRYKYMGYGRRSYWTLAPEMLVYRRLKLRGGA
jgi:hypothetical protein